MPFRYSLLLLAAVVGLATPVRAQTLGDVAREEEARRKELKQPAKVYTNKDLANVPPPSAPPDSAKVGPAEPSQNSPNGSVPDSKNDSKDGKDQPKDQNGKASAKDKDPGAVKDQAYWSGRMKDLRVQLERDQTFADALQSRINGLAADFSARDDPAQRDVIGRERQKALDELDRVRKAIVSDKQAVVDLEEEARRASVPPGWLR
jgi:hypothetical protein